MTSNGNGLIDSVDLEFLISHLREAVSNSWDGIILVDGLEGSGKSGLALETAYKLDPTFNINRVVFTSEQFFEAVDNSKPCQAIVWDEFITGGMSTEVMSKMQREVTKKMVMIRKKRLYIILVLPYFFMTGRYFAVARTRFLLHTYTPDGIRRGYWRAYNYDRKRQMYFRGRKEFDYCVTPYKTGKFSDFFKHGIFDKDAYEAKKDEATLSIGEEKKSATQQKHIATIKALIAILQERFNVERKEIIEAVPLSKNTLRMGGYFNNDSEIERKERERNKGLRVKKVYEYTGKIQRGKDFG